MAFDDEVEKQILHHCFNCWPCDVDFVWRNPSCLLFSLSRVVFMQVLNWTTSCPFICWSIGSNPPIEIGREFTRIIIHYLCPFLVRPICPFLSILCLFCFHGRSTNNLLIHIHVPVYQIINPKSRKIAREVDLEFNPS
jgi:hypothetical protein